MTTELVGDALERALDAHMARKSYPLWKPISKSLPTHHFLGLDGEIASRVAEKAEVRSADSNTTSPIVAQSLAPDIVPIFVRNFPLFDMIRKVPANGLSHTWQQQTGYTGTTDPNTIAESGTVQDDVNQYLRMTTNIAVFAIRRGVSLKAQFAGAAAGGVSSDLYARELEGGLRTLARDAQNETLRYQTSLNGSTTAADPNGKYDANGYNGLRYILQNEVPPENSVIVDISAPPWTDSRVLKGVRKMVNAIYDKGGSVDLLVTTSTGSEAMFEDELALTRYVKDGRTAEIIPGMTVRLISTDQGLIPVLVVPGNAIGSYTTGGHTYTDIMALNTDEVVMPYLGSPMPSVIKIPVAVGGQLTELAIPYCMYGLAALAPPYLGRVQLKTS